MPLDLLKIYEQLISQSPDHISIVSRDYRYLVVNGSYLNGHGLKREEIVGRKVSEVLGEDIFNKLVKGYLDRCFAGEAVKYDAWFEFRTAGRRFMSVAYHPFAGEDGAISGAVVISRDITAHKKADDSLKESEEKYRHLFENMEDAAFIADTETGLIVEANMQAEALMGRPRQEIIGMHQSQLHPSTKETEYRARFAERVENGRLADSDGEILRKDGSIVPVHIGASPFIAGGRRLILGIFRDITESKRAKEVLVQSKAFTESLIGSMQEGLIVLDGGRRVIDVNPAFLRMTGFSREDFLGRTPPLPYWHESEIEKIYKVLREVESGSRKEYELVFRKKSGEAFPVILTPATIKDGKGRVISFFATIKDLTQRRKLEDEALRNQKLDSLGTLAGGIAHDFNNVLTGIVSNISLAAHFSTDEKSRKRLADAEKACMRAKDLVHQFLTFAKGGSPIKKTVQVETRIKDWCAFAIAGSRSRCAFDIPEGLFPADIDEDLFSQAVNNVIINADQAMPEGGTINCSLANVEADSNGQALSAPHLRLTVKDTGVGIRVDDLQRVFDPYFTTKNGANGLGLATAYSIVSSHGGFIEVDSRPGEGSAFSLYVPASKETAQESAGDKLCKTRGRVLVMDDDEMIREAASEILDTVGCSVEEAREGGEAVRMYADALQKNAPFDLVIMDLTIPGGMGGREATQKILELDPAAKVVVSSGYSSDPIMSDFASYGFCGVIAKPYRASDISGLVKKLIG